MSTHQPYEFRRVVESSFPRLGETGAYERRSPEDLNYNCIPLQQGTRAAGGGLVTIQVLSGPKAYHIEKLLMPLFLLLNHLVMRPVCTVDRSRVSRRSRCS